jgi:hypothetical protein
LCEGYGLGLVWTIEERDDNKPTDLPKIADALVDLVYVALGTAHLHRLPWEALFTEVQRANVTKERCGIDHKFTRGGNGNCCHLSETGLNPPTYDLCGQPEVAHSKRGSAHDVIKPEGWRPPAILETLMRAGWLGPRLPMEED